MIGACHSRFPKREYPIRTVEDRPSELLGHRRWQVRLTGSILWVRVLECGRSKDRDGPVGSRRFDRELDARLAERFGLRNREPEPTPRDGRPSVGLSKASQLFALLRVEKMKSWTNLTFRKPKIRGIFRTACAGGKVRFYRLMLKRQSLGVDRGWWVVDGGN